MLRLLQVCNVGQIVGGTAACAWTVTKSLPTFDHCVACLQPISVETRRAFSHCRVFEWEAVTGSRVAAVAPDVVLLHNTSRSRTDDRRPAVTVQYLHSKIDPAPADGTLYCSRWLAQQYGAEAHHVCLQAVPKPERPEMHSETRSLREVPVIGRICTPQRRKWPNILVQFYAELAERSPEVHWEFIGCPRVLEERLRIACRNQAQFFAASWAMRSRLWLWDAMLYHNPHVTESFGRTVAEAMRAGCIPIVDDRGGFSEQVTDGCGFLCRSTNDFVNAVRHIHPPTVRRPMSRACRMHADATFSLTRFGHDLLQRFREAARRCRFHLVRQ